MTAPKAEMLAHACETSAAQDEVLAKAHDEIGVPVWRATEASYQSLARIVVYQLISTKAADAIWQRVCETLGNVTAQAVLAEVPDHLLACGLSRPKLQHLQAIALAVETGALDLPAIRELQIDEARRELIAVRGIGPWTADTFLMNALGHLDAFPHGEVGLIEAYRQLSGAEQRLEARVFSLQAEAWRPYRAVAAHLLYDWLNAGRKKGRA